MEKTKSYLDQYMATTWECYQGEAILDAFHAFGVASREPVSGVCPLGGARCPLVQCMPTFEVALIAYGCRCTVGRLDEHDIYILAAWHSDRGTPLPAGLDDLMRLTEEGRREALVAVLLSTVDWGLDSPAPAPLAA